MKKMIIGALVGGLILFIWQFLSWGLLNFHYSQNSYLENQDEVYELLKGKMPEGEYFLPTIPKGAGQDQMTKLQESMPGKPWMQIKYHESWDMNMPMNMTRGFVIDFFAVLLLCWILMKIPDLNMTTTLMTCIAIGLIGYFTISYLNSVWFGSNSLPDLLDAVAGWGLCGLWLGWWLNR